MKGIAGVLGLAALVAAGRAEAHAFESGADLYAQFIEGTLVVLAYPATLLSLLALGLLLTLWRLEGLLRVWPVFLAGLVAGVFVAPLAPSGFATALIAIGVLSAALAALLSSHYRAEAMCLAGVSGCLVMAASLEGHGLFELSVFIHLGIFFGANLSLAASAALTRLALETSKALWIRIGCRIAASWIAAILVLMLAFTLSTGADS